LREGCGDGEGRLWEQVPCEDSYRRMEIVRNRGGHAVQSAPSLDDVSWLVAGVRRGWRDWRRNGNAG
jgi:hypothetical protein